MIRIALRGIAHRPLRTILTALAVVLGVAMVSASFTATDTLRSAADSLSEESYKGTDAVVTTPVAYGNNYDVGGDKPVPASALEQVRQVPGVGVAVGDILETAKIVGKDGDTLGDGPYFGVGYDAATPGAAELNPFRLKDGRWAAGPDEVVIDASSADKESLSVGDKVRIATDVPARDFTVVGVARFGTVETLGVATAAIFELRTAQTLFSREDAYSDVLVSAAPGTSPEQLRANLYKALGSQYAVQTAQEHDRFTFDGLDEFITILKVILLAFGGIAILVGAFNIFNALNITVAQRTRELALARALGASRRQVMRSVVAEAAVTGVVASIIGLGFGYLLAMGVMELLVSVGADLPRSETVFEARTVIVALMLGTIVTVLAGLVPAARATRVAPVAAIREAMVDEVPKRTRKAKVATAVVGLLGIGLVALGLFGDGLSATEILGTLLPGVLLLFVATALVSPALVAPITKVVGWPARRFGGVAGSLATRNATRNPSRTSSTAAALMIGVALVTFVGVIGNGFKTMAVDRINDTVKADHVVVGSDGWSPFAGGASQAVAKADGVETVSAIRSREARIDGKTVFVDGVDPKTFADSYEFDFASGSQQTVASLSGGAAIVRESYAKKNDLAMGSRFDVLTPSGDKLALTVRGIQTSPAIDPLGMGEVAIAQSTFDTAFPPTQDRLALVRTDGTTTAATLEKALAGFPAAKVETRSGYADDQAAALDPLIAMLYVLLALAVIVSVFGIVNTLVLSVFERTRELGLVRAVGMSRRQVRRMMRHESIVTALIGAALGIGVGLFLSAGVTIALAEQGLSFAVPVGAIAAYVVVAVVCGVLAAILPARRASRMDVLGALAHE